MLPKKGAYAALGKVEPVVVPVLTLVIMSRSSTELCCVFRISAADHVAHWPKRMTSSWILAVDWLYSVKRRSNSRRTRAAWIMSCRMTLTTSAGSVASSVWPTPNAGTPDAERTAPAADWLASEDILTLSGAVPPCANAARDLGVPGGVVF